MNCVEAIPLMTALLYLRSTYGTGGNKILAGVLQEQGLKIDDRVLSSFLNGKRFFDDEVAVAVSQAANGILMSKFGWTTENIPPWIRYHLHFGMKARKAIGVESFIRGFGRDLRFEDEKQLNGIWRTFYFPNLEYRTESKPKVTSNIIFIRAYHLTPVARATIFVANEDWDGLIHIVGENAPSSGCPVPMIIYWSSAKKRSAVTYCGLKIGAMGRNMLAGVSSFFHLTDGDVPGSYFFSAQRLGVAGNALTADLSAVRPDLPASVIQSCADAGTALLAGELLKDDQDNAIRKLRSDEFDYDNIAKLYPEVRDMFTAISINQHNLFSCLEAGAVNLNVRFSSAPLAP